MKITKKLPLKDIIDLLEDSLIEVYSIDNSESAPYFNRLYVGEANKCFPQLLVLKVFSIYSKSDIISIGVIYEKNN